MISLRTVVPATTAVLTALVLTLGLLVVAAPPASAGKAADRYAQQAHNTTNKQRAKRSMGKLRKSACLKKFAVRQAKKMARQERIFHQRLSPILRECGLGLVGENVAVGYPNGRKVVNRGWMRSLGHRLNILNLGYREMAIAARRKNGRWYVAQVFSRRLL